MFQRFQKNEDVMFSSCNTVANLLMLIFASQKFNTSAGMELKFYFFGNICLRACSEAQALIALNTKSLAAQLSNAASVHTQSHVITINYVDAPDMQN